MNYKEETEYLISEIEKYNYNRAMIERDLMYSDNYIGQMLSKGSNAKIVAALKMLLRVKQLEQELQAERDKVVKAMPGETDMETLMRVLREIGASLHETAHNTELNQALIKAQLFHSAKLEAMINHRNHWTKKDHQKIVEDLNEVAAKIFFESHQMPVRDEVPA